VLLLIIILGATGFALKLLWIIALVARGAEGGRWYRW
jgi:hypothetical protein